MQRMRRAADSSTTIKQSTLKQSTLQRVLTTAINELGIDTTVAIINQEHGPLNPQVSRGFRGPWSGPCSISCLLPSSS